MQYSIGQAFICIITTQNKTRQNLTSTDKELNMLRTKGADTKYKPLVSKYTNAISTH